jgi:cytochrome c553
MTAADIHFFMENPRALNPAASMEPLIPPLSHEDVEAITQYLLTLPAEPATAEGSSQVRRSSP